MNSKKEMNSITATYNQMKEQNHYDEQKVGVKKKNCVLPLATNISNR